MSIVVGGGSTTVPLTKECFGVDGKDEIIGCIDELGCAGEIDSGNFTPHEFVMIAAHDDKIFLHPRLFGQCGQSTFWVKLSLQEGKIRMQPIERTTGVVIGLEYWSAEPVELEEIPVEFFLLLQRKVSEGKGQFPRLARRSIIGES